MPTTVLNYLHHGHALDDCVQLTSLPEQGRYAKQDLLERLSCSNGVRPDLAVLIRGFGPTFSKQLDVECFRRDFSNSLLLRTFFGSLECRGFSYKLDDEIELYEPLRKCITLKIALMPHELLFYPPRVRRYLRRVNRNHYFDNGYPSIAFALGMKAQGAWFVFVLQSDLAGCGRNEFNPQLCS